MSERAQAGGSAEGGRDADSPLSRGRDGGALFQDLGSMTPSQRQLPNQPTAPPRRPKTGVGLGYLMLLRVCGLCVCFLKLSNFQ